MKKVLVTLALTFLMAVCLTSQASADENTGLLNHFYTTDISSNSATVGWNIRGNDNYNFISFEQASDPSNFVEYVVYPSGGDGHEYKFTKSDLKPDTRYLVTLSNAAGQHMVHLTVITKDKICSHKTYVDTLSKTYTKRLNSNSHLVVEVYVRKCANCGIKLSEYEKVKSVSAHNFSANDIKTHKCKDCSYISNHVGDTGICGKCGAQLYKPLRNGISMLGWTKVYKFDALQLAKEGRLYATDNKGQVYKKIQVKGTFVDAYVSGQIKLSSNSVYVAMGLNNLVLYKNTSNGNIITCLKPELIPQVNERIKKFDIITAAAQKAYRTGLISKSRLDQIIADTNSLKVAFINAKKCSISSAFLKEINKKYIAVYGDSGEVVEEIQQKLLDLGYSNQLITGKYLDETFKNVAYFQILDNLKVTGLVDSETLERINELWYGPDILPNPAALIE